MPVSPYGDVHASCPDLGGSVALRLPAAAPAAWTAGQAITDRCWSVPR